MRLKNYYLEIDLLDIFFFHEARNRRTAYRAFPFGDWTTVGGSFDFTIGDLPLGAALDTISFVLHAKPPLLKLDYVLLLCQGEGYT